MTASPDFGHLGPMITRTRDELTAAGVSASPKAVLADAGYWHLEQMNEITADGIVVCIPPDSSRRCLLPDPLWCLHRASAGAQILVVCSAFARWAVAGSNRRPPACKAVLLVR